MKSALLCLSIFIVGAFAAPNIPDGRILGGQPAELGQLPYQASIQFCLQSTCQHACGGAIIGSLWVVSAAHCITQAPTLGSYQVLAGAVDLNEEGPGRQAVRVSYVIINPDYEGGINPHDIAIYRLVTPLEFNQQVQPIGIQDDEHDLDEPVIISGWGSTTATEIPTMPNRLQYIQTSILAPQTCQQALDSILGNGSHPLDVESNVCTGPLTGGVSTCTGDTGSPVADIQGQNLIGIVSWFVTPCGTVGAPSVHIKLSHYTRWIRASISI